MTSSTYLQFMQCYPGGFACIYMDLRRKVDTSYTYVGNMVVDWGELARLVHENHICAAHYMKWIWDFRTRHRPIAYINMITSPKSVKFYMDSTAYKDEDRERELRLKLDIQKDVVQTELTCGRELRNILLDESLVVGVVLRYALAFSGGLEELELQFRAEAEYELSYEPLYDKILGDKVPPKERLRHG